jgi:hypothetical protein
MLAKFLTSACALTLAVSALSLTGCGDDTPEATNPRKGKIDRPALESGVTVTIANDQVGSVQLPFEIEVPEVEGGTGGDDPFESELEGAVSLQVSSNASGTTANLTSGIIVDGNPDSAGQWSWQFNADRDVATMSFFNSTVTGLTLKSANTYDAALSIANNEYIESEDSFTFTVNVVGN